MTINGVVIFLNNRLILPNIEIKIKVRLLYAKFIKANKGAR